MENSLPYLIEFDIARKAIREEYINHLITLRNLLRKGEIALKKYQTKVNEAFQRGSSQLEEIGMSL